MVLNFSDNVKHHSVHALDAKCKDSSKEVEN